MELILLKKLQEAGVFQPPSPQDPRYEKGGWQKPADDLVNLIKAKKSSDSDVIRVLYWMVANLENLNQHTVATAYGEVFPISGDFYKEMKYLPYLDVGQESDIEPIAARAFMKLGREDLADVLERMYALNFIDDEGKAWAEVKKLKKQVKAISL